MDINNFRLQIMLNALGYDTYGIDGVIGRNTKNAVINFQNDYELNADGIAGQETINTMHAAFMENDIYTHGVVIQALLHNAGYSPGAIDGVVGRNTKNALRNFQNDYELDDSGEADDDTISTLKSILYGVD